MKICEKELFFCEHRVDHSPLVLGAVETESSCISSFFIHHYIHFIALLTTLILALPIGQLGKTPGSCRHPITTGLMFHLYGVMLLISCILFRNSNWCMVCWYLCDRSPRNSQQKMGKFYGLVWYRLWAIDMKFTVRDTFSDDLPGLHDSPDDPFIRQRSARISQGPSAPILCLMLPALTLEPY